MAEQVRKAVEREVSVLTQLRESEKRAIATWVLLISVVGSVLLLLLTLFELWFHPKDEFLLLRCLAYKSAMFEVDQSYTKYVVALFGFATGALAKDVGKIYSWRIGVIASIFGFAVAVLLAMNFDPLTAASGDQIAGIVRFCPTEEVLTDPRWLLDYPDAESDGEAFAIHLATGIKGLCTGLAVWYGSVAAALLGLNIDNLAKLASRAPGAAGA